MEVEPVVAKLNETLKLPLFLGALTSTLRAVELVDPAGSETVVANPDVVVYANEPLSVNAVVATAPLV